MTPVLLVNVGSHNVKLTLWRSASSRQHWQVPADSTPEAALAGIEAPLLTVHRVVHGGNILATAQPRSDDLDRALARLDGIAPLHNPPARRWAAACGSRWPAAAHVLVPDTGLFRDLPEATRTLPLPASLRDRFGLRQHGYHGLAHAGLLRGLREIDAALAGGRVITLQLGGGCSATAWQAGSPIETSMGFSPLAGLVMATRPGNLDPGALLHLLRQGLSLDDLDDLLHHQAGLLGLSGISGDMRVLLADASAAAELAVTQFCLRVRQVIGSQAATLGGLDALVFGGGIGEHQDSVRERICAALAFLGITLDAGANRTGKLPARLGSADARVAVWALPGREEEEMLLQAIACLDLE